MAIVTTIAINLDHTL